MAGSTDKPEENASPDHLIGTVIADRYEVQHLISEGGMGRVYRGVQRALERPVAIKCMHPHLMTSEAVVLRFLDEARVASRLTHPNIVEIYDFGRAPAEQGGHFYLVMELLEGVDLSAELARGPMPVPRVIDILRQVLSALGEAHDNGITHRDAKPENIIILPKRGRRDRVKLIDFGIAKAAGSQRLTQAGMLVGSPHYMSPEQINGGSVEVSADLYAVGSILFEALTGQLLFDDDHLMGILTKQLTAPRPDPRQVAPHREIPNDLAEVCLKAIHLDPQKRFASAEEFADALESARVSTPSVEKQPLAEKPDAAPAVVRENNLATDRTIAGQRDSSPVIDRSSGVVPLPQPPGDKKADSFDPQSLRYRVVQRATTFSELQRLEEKALIALARGDRPRALERLRSGIEQARQLYAQGEVELAASAYGTFGRRAAAMLREDNRLDEARGVLQELLEWRELSASARAHALEQLAMVHRASGAAESAESVLEEALGLAGALQEPELVARLKQLRRSTSSSPPPPPNPEQSEGGHRPKPSTFRSRRPEVDPNKIGRAR